MQNQYWPSRFMASAPLKQYEEILSHLLKRVRSDLHVFKNKHKCYKIPLGFSHMDSAGWSCNCVFQKKPVPNQCP